MLRIPACCIGVGLICLALLGGCGGPATTPAPAAAQPTSAPAVTQPTTAPAAVAALPAQVQPKPALVPEPAKPAEKAAAPPPPQLILATAPLRDTESRPLRTPAATAGAPQPVTSPSAPSPRPSSDGRAGLNPVANPPPTQVPATFGDCPNAWAVSPALEPPGSICPDAPLRGRGSEQHFERGLVLSVPGGFYALSTSASGLRTSSYIKDPADRHELDPGATLVPPHGFYAPAASLVGLWRSDALLRRQLGWAVTRAINYDTVVQSDGLPDGTTVYVKASDGGVWQLSPGNSGWFHSP
jgi:hypothetical protein